MRPEHYKLFAKLCESFVSEVSTSINLISNSPGGDDVIKKLHQDMGLAHNIDYSQVPKISWSDIKGSYRGSWVIIVGSQGTAAIKSQNDTYNTVASDGGEVQTMTDSRSDRTMNFIKSIVGKYQKFYVGRNTNYVSDIQKKRAGTKVDTTQTISQDSIIKKFKPLWIKSMEAAVADIKGMAQTMIKNDAYDKAEKKISILKNIEGAIDSVQSGSEDVPTWIRQAVGSAIHMAASHYYPDQTGEIQRPRYGSGYTSERSEGPQLLLKDISNGDTAKLGTILSFFKRSLISG